MAPSTQSGGVQTPKSLLCLDTLRLGLDSFERFAASLAFPHPPTLASSPAEQQAPNGREELRSAYRSLGTILTLRVSVAVPPLPSITLIATMSAPMPCRNSCLEACPGRITRI